MARKVDDNTFLNYLLQSLNVDDLKQICRDYEIKGYSKLTKEKLIDVILDSLAEEEVKDIINKKEIEIISAGIDLAIKKINGEDRERIAGIKVVNEEKHELELLFKGFNWEVKSFLSITSENMDKPDRDCDCRIGSNMGFCNHFWAGFIFSYKKGWIDLKKWSLTKLPDDFTEKLETIKLTETGGAAEEVTLVDETSEDADLIAFTNQSITIYEGEISELIQKQSEFQDNITIWYLATLTKARVGPKVQRKSDFREEDIKQIEKIHLRLSDKIMNDLELKVGDKIASSGKFTRDDFLRIYIVKNIRKVERV